MKKLLLSLISIFIAFAIFSSCKREDSVTTISCELIEDTAADSEVTYLQNWITDNGIDADKDDRGFFYKIHNAGSDERTNLCAYVKVSYKATTLDGYYVDKGDSTDFYLNSSSLITGWKEAVPLIGEGGKITFYLPPSLAYGAIGSSPKVAGNEYLIFELELHTIASTE